MQWCYEHPAWGIFFTLVLTGCFAIGTRNLKIIVLGRDPEAEESLERTRANNADNLVRVANAETALYNAKANSFTKLTKVVKSDWDDDEDSSD